VAERRCPVSEQMKAYIDARSEGIDGRAFARYTFDVHHGQLRRVRIEHTDEMASADDERLTA
jgi:hypothetical protein